MEKFINVNIKGNNLAFKRDEIIGVHYSDTSENEVTVILKDGKELKLASKFPLALYFEIFKQLYNIDV